jgi:peptidoglycan hydrolase-like protein with peptidoglycan-binding domain
MVPQAPGHEVAVPDPSRVPAHYLTAAGILQLQRLCGNQAVARLISTSTDESLSGLARTAPAPEPALPTAESEVTEHIEARAESTHTEALGHEVVQPTARHAAHAFTPGPRGLPRAGNPRLQIARRGPREGELAGRVMRSSRIGRMHAARPPPTAKVAQHQTSILQTSVLQRCGPVACGCSPAERAAKERLLQRATGDAGGADPPALLSAQLADSERLQRAYHNSPPLRLNETSDGVARLQAALVEVGFGHLLRKTMKSGKPDGSYGQETVAAVRAFQQKNGVRPVGGPEAGHKTLLALDRALGAGPSPSAPAADQATLPKTAQGVEEPGSKTDNGETVQAPKPKVNETSTTDKPVQDDDRLSGNVVVNLGGQVQWQTAKGTPPDGPKHNKDLDPLCENGVMQVGGKLNVPWFFNKGERKVRYVPEFELDVDFAPTICNRSPTLQLQVTAIKAQLNDTFELVFNASAGAQGPPAGWFAQGAGELDIHPFRKGILKPVEIDAQVNGGGLIIPSSQPGHDFKTGTFGLQAVLKYTF